MTVDDLRSMADDANVSIAAGESWRQNGRLEPRLWEALRIEFQSRYRLATGEEIAVLTIVKNPEAA